MTFSIGLDIGGTKIAGALFDQNRHEIEQVVVSTPSLYADLLAACHKMVTDFDQRCGSKASLGVGVPGTVNRKTGVVCFAANTPCIVGQSLRDDLKNLLGRTVEIANDADCAALSEATDGAGTGHDVVFGLIMGTGVGGGLVVRKQVVQGANGFTGEFGHTPLPFREASDGPVVLCDCGQTGCIDKSVSGPALARLYSSMIGHEADAFQIAERAKIGDADARRVLDQFMTTIAKAMIPIIHIFDPDVIAVSGGLSHLPYLYEEVPKRWGQFALRHELNTVFLPAQHGAISGLRGAAWLGHHQAR